MQRSFIDGCASLCDGESESDGMSESQVPLRKVRSAMKHYLMFFWLKRF